MAPLLVWGLGQANTSTLSRGCRRSVGSVQWSSRTICLGAPLRTSWSINTVALDGETLLTFLRRHARDEPSLPTPSFLLQRDRTPWRLLALTQPLPAAHIFSSESCSWHVQKPSVSHSRKTARTRTPHHHQE